MAKMTEIICKCGCGRKKMVRTADVKRGWGKFYSKSCKAKEQEDRTNQYRSYAGRQIAKLNGGRARELDYNDSIHPKDYGHMFVSGDEGHGQE